jgi:hypothetical protein
MFWVPALVIPLISCNLSGISSSSTDAYATDSGSETEALIARSAVGMNLSGIQAYTTAFPFMDVFKSSSEWVSGHGDVWNDGQRIDVDEKGWVRSLSPGQVVHSTFISEGIRAPSGQYVVEYEGEGEIAYQGCAEIVEHGTGYDVIEIDPEMGDCYLDIVSVNAQNYLRDIRIRLPFDAADDEIFNPVFLERIADFKTLRFMGWILGDNPDQLGQEDWSERPQVTDARWSENGVPIEIMIDLANRIAADLWINIPHQANDDYVRQFAELVQDELDPGLKVYVEHSNEVWNNTFSVFEFATRQGLELGLSTDSWEARLRYHALRSRQIFDIFEDVLGLERIVRVLAAQQDGPAEAEALLSYEDMADSVDALAIGSYFGIELGLPEAQDRVLQMTLDDLFHELETVTLPDAMRYVGENAAIAAQYQIPLVAYEGGQHLSSIMSGIDDPRINDLFDAANRDPRMGDIYSQLLDAWDEASGSGLFMHLDECGRMGAYGRWGLLEYIEQPRSEAPKYDAVMEWIEGTAK